MRCCSFVVISRAGQGRAGKTEDDDGLGVSALGDVIVGGSGIVNRIGLPRCRKIVPLVANGEFFVEREKTGQEKRRGFFCVLFMLLLVGLESTFDVRLLLVVETVFAMGSPPEKHVQGAFARYRSG